MFSGSLGVIAFSVFVKSYPAVDQKECNQARQSILSLGEIFGST